MPGTWGPLAHQPTFNAGTMLLLTDGTVMCQNSNTVQWFKLTPDSSGSYVNGTWTQLANCPNPRLYFASAVLRDGRVFVAGGEAAERENGGGGDPAPGQNERPLRLLRTSSHREVRHPRQSVGVDRQHVAG